MEYSAIASARKKFGFGKLIRMIRTTNGEDKAFFHNGPPWETRKVGTKIS
jgi:hypothetical protein